MSETFDRESVMRRIEKLLAIAQHERSDPNEAAAAAGMAERIMRKYQFSQADIIMGSLKKGDELGMSECVASAKTNGTKVLVVPPWASILAASVGKFTDCGARIGRTADTREACIHFYGFKPDVEMAKWMFDYLVGTTLRLCKQFKETDDYIAGGRREVNSYRQGVSTGIVRKIGELIAAKKQEEQAQSTSMALVVVKQQAITAKYGDFGYKTLKSRVSSGNAFAKGVVDGKRVDVARRAVASPTRGPRALLG